MNASPYKIIAILGLAAIGPFGAVGAHADDALAPEQTRAYVPMLSRADVHAGAVAAARSSPGELLWSQETAAPAMTRPADRNAVTAEAIAAERAGRISYGEVGGTAE